MFQGSKKHSRTRSMTLLLHRHPLRLPPSLHPGTNHKQAQKRRLCSYQLLQRATNHVLRTRHQTSFSLRKTAESFLQQPRAFDDPTLQDQPLHAKLCFLWMTQTYQLLCLQFTLHSLPGSSRAVWRNLGKFFGLQYPPPRCNADCWSMRARKALQKNQVLGENFSWAF